MNEKKEPTVGDIRHYQFPEKTSNGNTNVAWFEFVYTTTKGLPLPTSLRVVHHRDAGTVGIHLDSPPVRPGLPGTETTGEISEDILLTPEAAAELLKALQKI